MRVVRIFVPVEDNGGFWRVAKRTLYYFNFFKEE